MADDGRRALDEGLTGFTHLFNAMSPLTVREPGIVGAALENVSAYCGVIVDGRHVAPATLRIALRCRPNDRFMLVTDAMPTVGQAEKFFSLQGRSIVVENGQVTGGAELGVNVPQLASFGVDGLGRVYVTSTAGGVYRLDPAAAAASG